MKVGNLDLACFRIGMPQSNMHIFLLNVEGGDSDVLEGLRAQFGPVIIQIEISCVILVLRKYIAFAISTKACL